MSQKKLSNWRAVFCLIISLGVLLGSVASANAEAFLTDEATGVTLQQFGAAICDLEDMNSDGRGEFLVGAPGDNQNGLDAGAVFYYRSRPENSHGQQQIWRGVGGEMFGFSVARVGDVNSDGTPDFAVGAPLSNAGGAESGRVYLFWGGSSISSTPDLAINGATGGDQFGFSVSAAGDFNGDGEDDFIVGAPYRNEQSLENGAAYVIYGGNGGPSTDLADALVLSGEIAGDHFGYSVTDAGNFLGTSNACVAVGAPENLSAGAAYVFEGSSFPSSPNATFDLKIVNGAAAAPGSQYGFAVENAGRWNNDGYDDLAIGAPLCNESASAAGRVEVVFGGTSPSTSGDRYANGETATSHLGYALAGVGDVTGSSSEDLLMGAPGYDGDATDGGRAYLFAGGSNSTGDAGNLEVLSNSPLNPGTAADDFFGQAVASAGLFDDDAELDYIVAAPGGNIGNTSAAGFCWVADSGNAVVGNDLPQWQSGWAPDGTVDLVFSLPVALNRLEYLELSRVSYTQASQILWSGQVSLSSPVDLGSGLVFSGSAFQFNDANAPVDGEFHYRITGQTSDGSGFTQDALAGPGAYSGLVPEAQLALQPVWPNPFNPSASVRFRMPAGQSAVCRVTDVKGRLVATLFSGQGEGVWRTVTWNGVSDSGVKAASGVYLISVEAGGQRQVQRMVLAK